MAKNLVTALSAAAILAAGLAPAAADQLTLVCQSAVPRSQNDGSVHVNDPYKVFIDTAAQTERIDMPQSVPFPVSIDSQSIAGQYPNPVFPNTHIYTRIDRTTGAYEFHICDGGQCSAPPPAWVLTDKGSCQKGEQKF